VANDIPVYRGVGGRLTRRIETGDASDFHGVHGLGNETPDDAGVPEQNESAVDALLRLSRTHAGELTVVATGPLTNIAAALLADPGFADRIRLVFMGGAVTEPGNVTPTAEFNIWHDPEAADLVVASGVDFTMVGLDATHRARFGREHLARLEAAGEPLELTVRLLRYYFDSYSRFHRADSVPLHDPLAVGAALEPGYLETHEGTVFVECASPLTTGQTVFLRTEHTAGTGLPPQLAERARTSRGKVATGLGTEDFVEEFTSVLEGWRA
jgi:inosine-uridine nucleoside N-ribohydrolase